MQTLHNFMWDAMHPTPENMGKLKKRFEDINPTSLMPDDDCIICGDSMLDCRYYYCFKNGVMVHESCFALLTREEQKMMERQNEEAAV